MNVFISLDETTSDSQAFEGTENGGRFTAVRIRDAHGHVATIVTSPDSAANALALADALRAAALRYLPAQEQDRRDEHPDPGYEDECEARHVAAE